MTEPKPPQVSVDAIALMRQAEEVEELNENIERIIAALRERPTRQEVARKRRSSFMLVLTLSFLVIFAHDEHIEHCGPGAESKAAVNYILDLPPDQPVDRYELQRAASDATSDFCGVSFPLHSHDDELTWPNSNNLKGFLLYIILFVGGWAFALRKSPDPNDRRRDDPKHNP